MIGVSLKSKMVRNVIDLFALRIDWAFEAFCVSQLIKSEPIVEFKLKKYLSTTDIIAPSI